MPVPAVNRSNASLVRPLPADQWRCGFDKVISGNVDTDFMRVVKTGAGQAIGQANGSLVITTGTTANASTVARSVRAFDGSLVLRYSANLSQRIVQNAFYVELVDVIGDDLAFNINSATSVSVTIPNNTFTLQNVGQSMWLGAITSAAACISQRAAIASVDGNVVTFTVSGWASTGSGTLSLFGWNYHQVLYDGTTATACSFDAQRNGWASGATAATINTTASTHVGTYVAGNSEAAFMDQTGSSATGVETTRRGSRVRNVPPGDTKLYLQIRAVNGTSNPASTTTFTVGVTDVNSFDPTPVTIADVNPMSCNSPLPTEQAASVALTLSALPALIAGTALAGDVGQQYRANATGAASKQHLVAANSANATNVKNGAGRLIGWQFQNTTASIVYVKFHNSASTPTAGASVFMTVGIPANGKSEVTIEGGIAFSAGIGFTTVTDAADSGTTAVAANAIVGDIFYA